MIRLRRAEPADLEFFVDLLGHEDVRPFLAAGRATDEDAVRGEIERSTAEPGDFGRFVIDVQQGGEWRRAGICGFEVENRRSRIARLGGLAIHPDFRGRRLADEAARLFQHHLFLDLGYHRLELEIYAFNERAIRHAERAGFVSEGVKRKAYRRNDEWVDGVFFGLLGEDLQVDLLAEHVARFNAGVRSGDYGPMLDLFTEDAELAFEGVSVGPFSGREAIAAAYRERPPDGTVAVLDVKEDGDRIVAGYAWSAEPAVRAGELRLTHDGERIGKLVVTFERSP
jgi:RimJ/RimL family protein N-acetyltransferase